MVEYLSKKFMGNPELKYCSLDIETSGFDPKISDLLEVGFVFFIVEAKEGIAKGGRAKTGAKGTASGFKIIEEYTQVFKPTREVPANILGLTGILKEELEEAPAFEEHRAKIQEKLRNATIVGHNVAFDLNFLKALGLEFNGPVIDTLEIVQFILPTHHSYNLENLMHVFQVGHKDAHRALADSKAAVKLLEKMLRVYNGFPEELKFQVQKLLTAHNLPWKELLFTAMEGLTLPPKNKTRPLFKPDYKNIEIKDGVIYNFPLGENCVEDLALLLKSQPQKALLVVPKTQQASNLWKSGLAQAIFPPELHFNEKKFQKLLESKNITAEEAKFLIKILVWQRTNWQTDSIIDLNLSFTGGQFRNLITGGKLKEKLRHHLATCDLPTFFMLSQRGMHKDRAVVIAGLNEFEAAVSAGISSKVAWGFVNYHLKSYYNEEIGTGDGKFKEPITKLLDASDLFFGLVSALLQTDPPTFQYYKITPEVASSADFVKIKAAADNFIEKIKDYNSVIKSEDLEQTARNLSDFFVQDVNYVKWLELAANRCVFFSSPLDISGVVKKILTPYSSVSFADSLGNDKLMAYFMQRLGFDRFSVEQVTKKANNNGTNKKQVLKSALQALPLPGLNGKNKPIKFHFQAKVLAPEDLIKIIEPKNLPAAILFGSASQVKEFYEQNYEKLKSKAFLVAQNSSGGSSKMFRNFSIHGNSLLLATDKFVLKHLSGNNGLDPLDRLKVKTLVLGHLPFEQYTHPYQEALSARYNQPFEEYSLPKALYNLHCLVNFFHTQVLETIYLSDSKLAKGYAQNFVEYIKLFPNLETAKSA